MADAVARPEDVRPCPQPTCHGSLTLAENNETVLCGSCRCRPDGVFVPPPKWDNDDESAETGRPQYRHSGRVRLPGGYEAPYSERDERRPDGVTDAYTFDLTTHGDERIEQ